MLQIYHTFMYLAGSQERKCLFWGVEELNVIRFQGYFGTRYRSTISQSE